MVDSSEQQPCGVIYRNAMDVVIEQREALRAQLNAAMVRAERAESLVRQLTAMQARLVNAVQVVAPYHDVLDAIDNDSGSSGT